MKVLNNSCYFSPVNYRKYNFLPYSSNYSYDLSKSLSYLVRCYYQWKYSVELCNGHCFLFMLTYNDNNLPLFDDFFPCHSSKDIRDFTKRLNYYIKSKSASFEWSYFCSKEFGEKTKRPHYHFLLFTDFNESVDEICRLVNLAWITRDGSKGGFVSVSPKHGAEIKSFGALKYVIKYVIKDTSTRKYYDDIYQHIYMNNETSFDVDLDMQIYYYNNHCNNNNIVDNGTIDFLCEISKSKGFQKFRDAYISSKTDSDFRQWKNECGVKPQYSKRLGNFALQHISNNTIKIPDGENFKFVNIPLYLYRKLYYNYFQDGEKNVHYFLNEHGVALKYKQFNSHICNDVCFNYDLIRSSEYSNILKGDFSQSYDFIYRLTLYNSLYRDRFCPNLEDYVCDIDPKKDFIKFNTHAIFHPECHDFSSLSSSQKYNLITNFYQHKFSTYNNHPYFEEVSKYSNLLYDLTYQYYFNLFKNAQQSYDFVRRTRQQYYGET
ncbi:replication initiator protein [Capybara microvirus Cap3_SP_410]|nr:replication initiator protein [Capybara microvirus Cap3_SP_410]